MATGFRNLTVYIPKEIFNDFNKRHEEIGRLHNHIPDKSELKSINSWVFRLPTGDCGLPTFFFNMLSQKLPFD